MCSHLNSVFRLPLMLLEISSVSNELCSNNTSEFSIFLASVSLSGISGFDVKRDDERWEDLDLSPSFVSLVKLPDPPFHVSLSPKLEGGFCRFLFSGMLAGGAGAGLGLSSVVKFIIILMATGLHRSRAVYDDNWLVLY